MDKLPAVISCLVLTIAAATAQTAQTTSERPLPQWLTGVIALSAFLFLAFVSFLVKKAWCDKSSRKTRDSESVRENEFVMTNGNMYDTTLDTDRKRTMDADSETENTYETALDMVRKRTMDSDSETENTYETALDMVRSKEDTNAYDNRITDITDDKATPM